MGKADVPLAVRVRRRTDALAREMLDAFVHVLPVYGELPREQLQGEILDILRHNLLVFFRLAETGGTPTDEDLAPVRASAARRAEERIPLEVLLSAYHLGARLGWQALQDEARPDEAEELLTMAGRLLSYTQSITTAVAEAYLDERQAIYGEERDARRAYVDALLSGSATRGMADRAGHRPADAYLVLAVAVATHPDERAHGVQAAVAGRRKIRRIEAHLSAVVGDDVLSLLGPTGGTVLLPATQPDVAALVDGLGEAAGAPVTAVVAHAEGAAGIPAAAWEAGDVLRLVLALRRPPGAYRLDDLVLEYAVTRDASVTGRLARLLDPLDGGPELLATLETYFALDLDRRATASRLSVHPNTLDYRLRRIAELTGLAVQTTRGLQLLGAALVARRVTDGFA